MAKMFKNMRLLLGVLLLNASIHHGALAQVAPATTETPSLYNEFFNFVPAPTVTPSPSPYSGRLNWVTEEGNFKHSFKSLSEVYEVSDGNNYNQTLKKESEIIVMNGRCAEGYTPDKVTFSLYRFYDEDIAPVVKSYLDYRNTHPNTPDLKQRDRALINEVIRILAISRFPRKTECDLVPIALALPFGVLRLEVDDSASPLVGPKINDGFLYDGLMQNSNLLRSGMVLKQEFWEKNGYNRFSTAQEALNVAALLPGKKVLMFNQTYFSIYRFGDYPFDYKAADTQYDVFKTTPVRKGWKIVAIVLGKNFIPLYGPDAK